MIQKRARRNNLAKSIIVLLCIIVLICSAFLFTIRISNNYNQRKIEKQQCIEVISEKALEKLDNVGFIKVLKYDARIDRYMILVANEQDTHAIVYEMRYFEKKEDCVPIMFMEARGPNSTNNILSTGR